MYLNDRPTCEWKVAFSYGWAPKEKTLRLRARGSRVNSGVIDWFQRKDLVAGAGFEPTTFGL